MKSTCFKKENNKFKSEYPKLMGFYNKNNNECLFIVLITDETNRGVVIWSEESMYPVGCIEVWNIETNKNWKNIDFKVVLEND